MEKRADEPEGHPLFFYSFVSMISKVLFISFPNVFEEGKDNGEKVMGLLDLHGKGEHKKVCFCILFAWLVPILDRIEEEKVLLVWCNNFWLWLWFGRICQRILLHFYV